MTLSRNVLAASAAVVLLLPAAASAHGNGLKLGQLLDNRTTMGLHLGTTIGQRDQEASTTAHLDREDRDDERGERGAHASTTQAFVASTTAARLSAKAQRLIAVSDVMGSLSGNLAARIASSSLSASSTAKAQAKLGDYTTNVAQAKTQAQAALSLSNQIASTSASSTVVSQAQADIKAARGFIRTAQQDLKAIFKVLFSL